MLKSKEIVFQNSRRRTAVTPPQPLPDILGVTITNHLSAQSLYRYALCVLRHHGMTEIGLHAVFRAVVVSRLTYASPAFTATDSQRVDTFLRRSKRCGFCPPDLPDFDQLLEEADDQLIERILNNPHHSYFNRNPQHHRTIRPTSDAARMTDNCMKTKNT